MEMKFSNWILKNKIALVTSGKTGTKNCSFGNKQILHGNDNSDMQNEFITTIHNMLNRKKNIVIPLVEEVLEEDWQSVP